MSNVIRLPTAPTSYFIVQKHRGGWAAVLVAPVGSLKPIKTILATRLDKAEIVAFAEAAAARQMREFRR